MRAGFLRIPCDFLAGALRMALQSSPCRRERPATSRTQERIDMSTKVTARTIVGSLRLVGVTAAVAAGIAGFAGVDTGAATPTDVVVVSANGHLPQLPEQACEHARDNASSTARPFLSCLLIEDDSPIDGPIIFS
jgi:hypothetical protein